MFRFNFFLGSICISLLFVALFYSSAFSTTLIIEDGQLMGATDVLVKSEFYHVDFVDGTAADTFYDLTSQKYVFTFTSMETANEAAEALLDQVLINTNEYDFDDTPSLTSGISDPSSGNILIPFVWNGTYLVAQAATNSMVEDLDSATGFTGIPEDADMALETQFTYAVWTPSSPPSPIPEPATFLLLSTGLLSFAGLKKKKYFNKA